MMNDELKEQLSFNSSFIIHRSSFTSMRPILIIEDDPDIAESVRYNLEREGLAARGVIARDDAIDESYNRIFHDLIDMMVNDSTTTTRGARLLLVAKHIERIADYVTDICELTVYMTEAAFIKHSN